MSKKEERRRRELERLQKAIERQKAETRSEREAESAPVESEAEEKVQPDREAPGSSSEAEVSWDWGRFWERFEAADLEGKEALFEKALASGRWAAVVRLRYWARSVPCLTWTIHSTGPAMLRW